jgi:cobalt/nickel transport system permease protein
LYLSPIKLHIPDGFLSNFVSILFWIASILIIVIALRKINRSLNERDLPLMGVLAAAIFAGQMINFTIIGGTSGHLMGAALATILLGPWAAILVMTSVVSIQALIFQDGGLLVLGANIFNMGIVAVSISYLIFHLIKKFSKEQRWGIYFGSFIAAWCSTLIASLSAALMLSISGTSPANIVVPAMVGIHALIGIGEGLITFGAVSFIYANRPDLIVDNSIKQNGNHSIIIFGGLITVGLLFLSPLASSFPDGLETVAKESGFLNLAKQSLIQIIPNYVFPGLQNGAVAKIVAGILGATIAFIVICGFRNRSKIVNRETISVEHNK